MTEEPNLKTSAQLATEKLPSPVGLKPFEINGKFYDPSHPPKLYQIAGDRQEYQGGIELDRDTAYSMKGYEPKKLYHYLV